jgi:hypothetical protein
VRIDRLKLSLDSMGGGAWPFLVGGVICLVNSDNERDLNLLNSDGKLFGRCSVCVSYCVLDFGPA